MLGQYFVSELRRLAGNALARVSPDGDAPHPLGELLSSLVQAAECGSPRSLARAARAQWAGRRGSFKATGSGSSDEDLFSGFRLGQSWPAGLDKAAAAAAGGVDEGDSSAVAG